MDATLGQTLWQLVTVLGTLVRQLAELGVPWLLAAFGIAWCLFGVHWSKTWRVLGQGGWAPLVLCIFLVALVWSQLAPGECWCLGFPIPNFWWQLGEVSLFVAIAMLCGYLQSQFHWEPAEVDLNPPAHHHGEHGHDHSHGHAHGH